MSVLTAQNVIDRAYREINITAIGVPPSQVQSNEGLNRLNAWFRIMFGDKLGEPLQDWQVPSGQRTAPVAAAFPQLPYPQGTDWNLMGTPLPGSVGPTLWPYPPQNSRLIVALQQNTTVWFPEAPSDGARMALIGGATASATPFTLTIDGNGRFIIPTSAANPVPTITVASPVVGRMRWIYRADMGTWVPLADMALTDPIPLADDMEDYLAIGLAIRIAPGNDKTVSPETIKAYKDGERIFEARYKQYGLTTYNSQDVPTSYESFLGGRYWW
jgi:hypothetical protein